MILYNYSERLCKNFNYENLHPDNPAIIKGHEHVRQFFAKHRCLNAMLETIEYKTCFLQHKLMKMDKQIAKTDEI